MPESARICCCGSDAWTKVIAVMQIVTSVFVVVLLVVVLVTMEDFLATSEDPDLKSFIEMGSTCRTVVVSLLIVNAIISFGMGIFLMHGAKKRSPTYLCAWVIYDAIFLVILIIGQLVFIFYSPFPIFDLMFITLNISLNVFLIWIVYTFQEQVSENMDRGRKNGGGGGRGDQNDDASVNYKI